MALVTISFEHILERLRTSMNGTVGMLLEAWRDKDIRTRKNDVLRPRTYYSKRNEFRRNPNRP